MACDCSNSSAAFPRLFPAASSLVFLGIVVSVLSFFAPPALAQTAPRITAAVDDEVRTTLHGNTPPQVAKAQDLGAVQDATTASLFLVLRRSDAQEADLRRTVDALHDPSSPQYHKWLTSAEFAKRFGTSDEDIQTISTWLAGQGFTVKNVSHGKAAIAFSGTAGQVRAAFHTELHTYQQDGKIFHSNNADPQIPSALASVVGGIAALNDIPPVSFMQVKGKALFNPKTHATTPQWSYPGDQGGVYLVTAPGDLAVQYDLNPMYKAGLDGSGVNIAIVGQSDVDNSVIANYHTLFGLPANLPQTVVDGADPGIDGDLAGVEADLDAEVSGSTAPNAKIYMYTSYDTSVTFGLFDAAIRAVDDNIGDVISMSYGICEPTLGLSGNVLFNQLWSQAAAQGQSVFVASGDSGGGACDNGRSAVAHGLAVNGFASTPYNVAVGGTDFYYSDYANTNAAVAQIETYWNAKGSTSPTVSLLQPAPEQPWNDAFGLNVGGGVDDTTTAAGGGGVSNCTQGVAGAQDSYFSSYVSCTGGYPKPAWQVAPGVPNDGARDLPDVSLFAANGANFSFYPVCAEPTDCNPNDLDPNTGAEVITGVGGTSAATPLMAGIMALIDQSLKGRQGNPNYVLYQLAQQTPSVFHDITAGNNNVPCTSGTLNCSLDANGDGYYTLQNYSAGPGYDLASGLGSIDANALLANWGKAKFTSTTTTLEVSSVAFAHGAPVTVTSTVNSTGGTPTGTVSLIASNGAGQRVSYGPLTLVNGTGQAIMNSLPAGTYTLTAEYGGDGTYAASASDPIQLTVTPENSQIAIGGTYWGINATGDNTAGAPITNGMSTLYGSFFDMDVQVYGASSTASAPDGIPTGTVTINDNGTAITTLTLDSHGIAELQSGSFAAGTHVLTFTYNGDGSFNSYTSPSYTINITKGMPQILLSMITSQVPAGVPLPIPVMVTTADGQLPLTGTLTVTVNGQSQTVPLQQSNALGLSSIGYGTANFTITQPGTYTVNASYSGDSNLAPIDHAYTTPSVTVFDAGSLATTTTTMTVDSSSITPGGTVNATVKVTSSGGHIPSGFVTIYQDGFGLLILNQLDATGSVTVPIPASAIINSSTIQLQAGYGGDSYNAASISSSVPLQAEVGDYALTTSSAAMTIKSGSTGTAIIFAGSPFGQRMQGTVALTCTTSDAKLGCSFSPTSISLPSDPTKFSTSTLTLTTTTQATGTTQSRNRMDGIAGGAGAVLALVFFALPRNRKRFHSVWMVVIALVAAAAMMSGCGGGGKPTTTTTPPPSLAPGSYTATVNAVSNGITHTLNIRVTVE